MDQARLSALRRDIATIEGRPAGLDEDGARSFELKTARSRESGEKLVSFGVEALDRQLGGGLPLAALHEFRCQESRASGALTGFAAALLARLGAVRAKPILWIEEEMALAETGHPFGAGFASFGLDPGRLILIRARRPEEALWALEEGLRCTGLAAALAVIRGTPRALDLTASRRLALRAAEHGVAGLLLREAGEAEPGAATTRWRIAPQPAAAMDGFAEGVGRPGARSWRRAGSARPGVSMWSGIMSTNVSPHPPRRILSLVLPFLATDRITRLRQGRSWRCGRPAEPEAPLAVVAKVKSAVRLLALNAPAFRLGLTRGQALAEALAIHPALDAVEADPAADATLLSEIADWADRYTPLVGTDGADGLLLDITGSAHLFGGEAALVADLVARLQRQGLAAYAAVADTPGAAFAAARFGGPAVVEPGGQTAMLMPLPLLALRLPPETVAMLERVGLKRIGQLVGAPRAPLAARFGAGLLRRLDEALGVEEEAISPRRPMPALIAERRFAEPISLLSDIAAIVLSLAAALALRLEERGAGGRRFELALYRVDGVVSRAEIGTGRPLRVPRLIGELFAEKFATLGEDFDAGYGFEMVRLSVLAADRDAPAQIDLSGEADGEADLARLIDRIGVRLGQGRVLRLAPRESHVPERSASAVPAAVDARLAAWPEPVAGERIGRPLRLFATAEPVETIAEIPEGPPLRFRWRRALYEVTRAEGPERIAAEWWREDGRTRDYYRVEDRRGHRFWLYREGLYERETAAPRWFLQGLFG